MQTVTESKRRMADIRMSHLEDAYSCVRDEHRILRDIFIPGRGRFHSDERKRKRNPRINPRAQFARATLASGIHAGVTSPTRPWIKSTLAGDDQSEFGGNKEWLAIVDQRMLMWFAKSNLYQALPAMYAEFGSIGTMCALLVEDPLTLFRVETYTVGEYRLARNGKGQYDTLGLPGRQFTVRQLVDRFTLDKVSPQTRAAYANPTQRENKVEVFHLVEPDPAGGWMSCWYETAHNDAPPLKVAHYDDNPIMAASWDYVGTDPYACDCPGMVVRGAANALEINEVENALALERMHNPPMQGPTKKVNLKPGSYTQVDDVQAAKGGIRSVYEFRGDTNGLRENMSRRESVIDRAFMVDYFLRLSMDERNQRATAAEVYAISDEKVVVLGPMMQSMDDMFRVLYDFVFGLMVKKSIPIWDGILDGEPLLPPPPEGIDSDVEPEFISVLHMAQRAHGLQGIERTVGFAGQIAQMTGKAPEKIDLDQAIDEYATRSGAPAKMVRDDEAVAAMRKAEAQQAQIQQMAAMAPAIKDAAAAAKLAGEAVPQEESALAGLGQALQ
jgi:hypothetical protein